MIFTFSDNISIFSFAFISPLKLVSFELTNILFASKLDFFNSSYLLINFISSVTKYVSLSSTIDLRVILSALIFKLSKAFNLAPSINILLLNRLILSNKSF